MHSLALALGGKSSPRKQGTSVSVFGAKFSTFGFRRYETGEQRRVLDSLVFWEGSKRSRKLFVRSVLASTVKRLFGHPFHLLNMSPLPALLSFAFLGGAFYLICTLKLGVRFGGLVHGIWISLLGAVMLLWILEVAFEERAGFHTYEVQAGFRLGVLLFIASEVMLFVAFFWGYFHASLTPSIWLGGSWAPVGIESFNWWRVPLLNTLLLLSSGLSLTVAHFWALRGDRVDTAQFWSDVLDITMWRKHMRRRVNKHKRLPMLLGKDVTPVNIIATSYELFGSSKHWVKAIHSCNVLSLKFFGRKNVEGGVSRTLENTVWSNPRVWTADTVLRGAAFLLFQVFEYVAALFSINDSVFGSLFFSLTGLHGFHVFVGLVFLAYLLVDGSFTTRHRQYPCFYVVIGMPHVNGHRVVKHRVAYEASIWYWHFVDIVWLLVVVVVYWWGARVGL